MKLQNARSANPVAKIGLFAGPALALLILLAGAPAGLADGSQLAPAWTTLALLIWMAVWWVTEAIPIPVTSLLPLVVLPIAGVASIKDVAAPYMHPIVVLLLGGFVFAKAIERWGLHERIALNVVGRSGGSPAGLVGGFMLASALLSMWISNSATAIMMVPIALSVAAALRNGNEERHRDLTYALLLGIAYACSIGGLGTPIGTPTNLIVIGYLNDQAGRSIDFAQWAMLGIPAVALLLPLAWLALTRLAFTLPELNMTIAKERVAEKLESLGRFSRPEMRTSMIFAVIASLWAFRRPINDIEFSVNGEVLAPFAGLTDHVTAIIAVLLCFLVPAGCRKNQGKRILDWKAAEQIPWGVLLLFGGGMSLAQAISSTGLSTYIGESLAFVGELPVPVLVLIVCGAVLLLTEVTSNIATASALMPVLGAVALETGVPIEVVAAPVALAASCAFMLPMATGPNAVVFATDKVPLSVMARAGARLNLAALLVVSLLAYLMAPLALA